MALTRARKTEATTGDTDGAVVHEPPTRATTTKPATWILDGTGELLPAQRLKRSGSSLRWLMEQTSTSAWATEEISLGR
jgi:hypothetical protein